MDNVRIKKGKTAMAEKANKIIFILATKETVSRGKSSN